MDLVAESVDDEQDGTAYLQQAVMSGRMMAEVADQGMLPDVERLERVADWRELRLPDPLVRRIEDYESEHGAVSLVNYVHAIDDVPVLMVADSGSEARAEDAVVFSYSEATIAVKTQTASAHTVVCRREA